MRDWIDVFNSKHPGKRVKFATPTGHRMVSPRLVSALFSIHAVPEVVEEVAVEEEEESGTPSVSRQQSSSETATRPSGVEVDQTSLTPLTKKSEREPELLEEIRLLLLPRSYIYARLTIPFHFAEFYSWFKYLTLENYTERTTLRLENNVDNPHLKMGNDLAGLLTRLLQLLLITINPNTLLDVSNVYAAKYTDMHMAPKILEKDFLALQTADLPSAGYVGNRKPSTNMREVKTMSTIFDYAITYQPPKKTSKSET